jgi:hypothetical protein
MDKGSLDAEATWMTGSPLVTRVGFEDSAQPTGMLSNRDSLPIVVMV